MTETTFIQVILPLRLEWEPVYYVPDGSRVQLGERVMVNFAGKTYTAAVSNTDARKEASEMDAGRIKPISGIAELLQPITKEEIELWRKVAGYYLCTVGEVYKAAYPDWKISEEKVKARKAHIQKLKEYSIAAGLPFSMEPQAPARLKFILSWLKRPLRKGVTYCIWCQK